MAATDASKKESKSVLSGGRKCFKCDSPYHLANSPDCPYFKNRPPKNGNQGNNNENQGEKDNNDFFMHGNTYTLLMKISPF